MRRRQWETGRGEEEGGGGGSRANLLLLHEVGDEARHETVHGSLGVGGRPPLCLTHEPELQEGSGVPDAVGASWRGGGRRVEEWCGGSGTGEQRVYPGSR